MNDFFNPFACCNVDFSKYQSLLGKSVEAFAEANRAFLQNIRNISDSNTSFMQKQMQEGIKYTQDSIANMANLKPDHHNTQFIKLLNEYCHHSKKTLDEAAAAFSQYAEDYKEKMMNLASECSIHKNTNTAKASAK